MHNRPVYKVILKSGKDITSKMVKYMILFMGSARDADAANLREYAINTLVFQI